MDATRFLKNLNQKGIAVVYLAIILVALIGISALVIDFGFRHVVKSQLQNAADSGALAGAGDYKSQLNKRLSNPTLPIDITQSLIVARQMAQANSAAGVPVKIGNDGSNTLSNSNDITLGFWDYSTHVYSAQTTKINAVQVRARRTADSSSVNQGPIDTFFGTIFGFTNLDVKAEAIAGWPIRATANLAICVDACSNTNIPNPPGERILSTGPTIPNDEKYAWTSLLIPQSSASGIQAFICNPPPNDSVCAVSPIYTTMGTQSSTMRDLQSLMYDPGIDSDNKDCTTNGTDITTCTPSSAHVKNWRVIVPVTKDCPPGSQGGADPHPVVQYAKIQIKAICGSGSSSGKSCWPNSKGPYPGLCASYANNVVVINQISCAECGDPNSLPGLKPALLK